MIKKKDREIINHLRQNSRQKLTEISQKTGMPITTIFDRIRECERLVIKKHTCIVDFSRFGYNSISHIAFKINKGHFDEAKSFLSEHPSVNSLYRINNNYDFLVEVVFSNHAEIKDFLNYLKYMGAKNIASFNHIDELKKEDFMFSKHIWDST